MTTVSRETRQRQLGALAWALALTLGAGCADCRPETGPDHHAADDGTGSGRGVWPYAPDGAELDAGAPEQRPAWVLTQERPLPGVRACERLGETGLVCVTGDGLGVLAVDGAGQVLDAAGAGQQIQVLVGEAGSLLPLSDTQAVVTVRDANHVWWARHWGQRVTFTRVNLPGPALDAALVNDVLVVLHRVPDEPGALTAIAHAMEGPLLEEMRPSVPVPVSPTAIDVQGPLALIPSLRERALTRVAVTATPDPPGGGSGDLYLTPALAPQPAVPLPFRALRTVPLPDGSLLATPVNGVRAVRIAPTLDSELPATQELQLPAPFSTLLALPDGTLLGWSAADRTLLHFALPDFVPVGPTPTGAAATPDSATPAAGSGGLPQFGAGTTRALLRGPSTPLARTLAQTPYPADLLDWAWSAETSELWTLSGDGALVRWRVGATFEKVAETEQEGLTGLVDFGDAGVLVISGDGGWR